MAMAGRQSLLAPIFLLMIFYRQLVCEHVIHQINPEFTHNKIIILMAGPCSGKHFISILGTDYIQKRRGEPGRFSFEYNLLPKLI